MMIHKPTRSTRALARVVLLRHTSHSPDLISPSSQPLRFLHDGIGSLDANSVTAQMINYALSHARSRKSDESYAQGMLVLEQCLSTRSYEDRVAHDWKGMVCLAMSDLFYERGNFAGAIDRLQKILNLKQSSLVVRVAAVEAIVGLHIQSGQDELAYKCFQMLTNNEGKSVQVVAARVKALKGFVELINGNIESAESFFQGLEEQEVCTGNVALSYGEFLHATGNFSLAKEMYQKTIQGVSGHEEFSDINALGACNMASKEVKLAATFALGQLESFMGNFTGAEETLTRALIKAEEYFGHNHPKVGVVLTGMAFMYRNKARHERSSSFLILEGLFRKALQFLRAPPIESKETNVERKDIVALARGGYAELLCVQENRKKEGEKIKAWAEAAWRNRCLSLAEAMNISEPSNKFAVVDARTSRVL